MQIFYGVMVKKTVLGAIFPSARVSFARQNRFVGKILIDVDARPDYMTDEEAFSSHARHVSGGELIELRFAVDSQRALRRSSLNTGCEARKPSGAEWRSTESRCVSIIPSPWNALHALAWVCVRVYTQ
ncbi:hypothetical protein PUN28_018471 [Cardiocondyla obscurior]|uniref:Uncharacterized protein n=1 Tax=Cardiocondyla obscurior TaxID=286306 RepID=A0AAW2EG60_9HYME